MFDAKQSDCAIRVSVPCRSQMCAKSDNIEHVIPALAVFLHHKLNCANTGTGGPF